MRTAVWVFIAMTLYMMAGCNGASTGEDTLQIAIVPSEDAELMAEGFDPIREQLATDLGMEVEFAAVTDYASVIEAMRGDKVDVAWYGPLSMVLANRIADAEPFVIARMEGLGETYVSRFIARADLNADDLSDLRGLTAAFVDPSSTSGNLVPRSEVMKTTGETAEDFFGNLIYAGSHDAALLALTSGSVDVAAIQDLTYDNAVERGEVDPNEFVIVHESPDIPQSPLAFRGSLDENLKQQIRDSFLAMHTHDFEMEVPGMGRVIEFLPIDYTAYEPIQEMAENLELTPEELAN